MNYYLRSFIRQGSARVLGPQCFVAFCHLGTMQPLLLHLEPNNPKDGSAVRLSDLFGQACGYVAREHAGEVSARIRGGEVLLCRTDGPCLCVRRNIIIWSEGQEEKRKKRKRSLAMMGCKITFEENV